MACEVHRDPFTSCMHWVFIKTVFNCFRQTQKTHWVVIYIYIYYKHPMKGPHISCNMLGPRRCLHALAQKYECRDEALRARETPWVPHGREPLPADCLNTTDQLTSILPGQMTLRVVQPSEVESRRMRMPYRKVSA